MESRSPRRRRSSRRQLGSQPGGSEEDRISPLPDDLLLLILARLGCARTAARTSALSRSWRGRGQLWTRLPALVFPDVTVPSLEAAFGRVSRPPPAVSLLEIRVVPDQQFVDNTRVDSMFRAAARLEPEELVFERPVNLIQNGCFLVDLPCFHRATSITLILPGDILRVPAGIKFPALVTLSLSGCYISVPSLFSHCPCLRTLRLSNVVFTPFRSASVKSASLRELIIDCPADKRVNGVLIVAPMLKQLKVSLTLTVCDDGISVLAPMVEMISWQCQHTYHYAYFGWRLEKVILETPERQGQHTSLQLHLYHGSHISLEETNITQQIEKHMIVEFSALELHLTTKGHVFGPLVSHLIGMNRICRSMQRLKVVQQRSVNEEECTLGCPCDSASWRSQTRSLTALEEVEINGFEGDEHEIAFLKVIFRRAPILRRMVVKLSDEASSSNFGRRKISHIFRAWSSKEFYVHSTSDEYVFRRLD